MKNIGNRVICKTFNDTTGEITTYEAKFKNEKEAAKFAKKNPLKFGVVYVD